MLIIDKVSKKYKNGHWGLVDFSLEVSPGEIVCLAGPNGSGKTTLINIIFQTITQTSGSVMYCGEYNSSVCFKRSVVCVPDETIMLELLTGKEYIEFVGQLYGCLSDRAHKLISLFGMGAFMNSPIYTYSHGMKKKIQYIIAFMTDAKVIVMDEPYRGLDIEATIILEKLIENFAHRGGSLLIASHDLYMAEKICDRMVIISKGNMLDSAPVKKLKEKYKTDDIEEVFLKSAMLEGSYDRIKKKLHDLYDTDNSVEKADK